MQKKYIHLIRFDVDELSSIYTVFDIYRRKNLPLLVLYRAVFIEIKKKNF